MLLSPLRMILCTELLVIKTYDSRRWWSIPELGDAAHWEAALHRLVAIPVKEAANSGDTDDPKFGDDAHCGAAFHRPVASPAKEAADAVDTDDPEFRDVVYCIE